MPKENHASHHSTIVARLLLVVVLAILSAGNFAFWKFAFFKLNPFPAMPGLVVGCVLASTVLIGAIWFRKPLARTALIVFTWIMMFIFSMPGLIMISDRATLQSGSIRTLVAGLGAYLLANIILILAEPIHRLGSSRGCGGR